MSPTSRRREEAVRGLELEISQLLRRVRRGAAARAAHVDPAMSATAYPLLVTLAEYGPRRAAELAEMYLLDKGAVSRIVHQLLDLGLIERAPDPDDGRASILSVTPKATERLASMVERRLEIFDAKLAEWEPDSIDELAQGLARFNTAISD